MEFAFIDNHAKALVSKRAVTTGSGKQLMIYEFSELNYLETQAAMQEFAWNRGRSSQDQIWLLQHPKVYTQGTACVQQPLMPTDIEVVKSDRGGQITYHGPGQIIMYPLLRLKTYSIGVKSLVYFLEQAIIDLLAQYNIEGKRNDGAPGIYVAESKIASLGLRIRRGTSYHGLSLNVKMDLSPFGNIDPCGYQGLKVTQMADFATDSKLAIPEIGENLVNLFCAQL